MLTTRETATILAALLFWREEMCPHGRTIMRPYFAHFKRPRTRPLSAEEIDQLTRRFQATLPRSR